MGKKILINNIFVGGYGYDKENLPHEVINLIRTDMKTVTNEDGDTKKIPGDFYVYITPSGVVNIKENELKAIIFVRSVGNGLVEVLAKAEGNMKYLPKVKVAKKNSNPILDEVIMTDLNYGGCNIVDIFKGNKDDYGIYATFKVEKLCLVKKTFYLTNNSNIKQIDPRSENIILISNNETDFGKKNNNQSERVYYEEDTNSYNILLELINNEDYWQDEGVTPYYNEGLSCYESNNIFKASLQDDNEVVFTNMLYYYLSNYKSICDDFIKHVLKLDVDLTKEYQVYREKDKMDISIVSSDNFFIIMENKIHSGINGIKYDNETREIIKKDGKIVSQLSVYYEKALAKMNGDCNKVKCFLLHPNYSHFNLKEYLCGDKYSLDVKYFDLEEFFHELYLDNLDSKNDYKYLEDFTSSLYKHTLSTNDEFKNEMYLRFCNRIDKLKGIK